MIWQKFFPKKKKKKNQTKTDPKSICVSHSSLKQITFVSVQSQRREHFISSLLMGIVCFSLFNSAGKLCIFFQDWQCCYRFSKELVGELSLLKATLWVKYERAAFYIISRHHFIQHVNFSIKHFSGCILLSQNSQIVIWEQKKRHKLQV